jgi:uncharacterized protein YjbJ (UPF0337 family)
MTLSASPKFLDPAALRLAASVFEKALRAVATEDSAASAHWIRRTVAKKILEDLFTGERDPGRLLLSALDHLRATAQVSINRPELCDLSRIKAEEAEEASMPIDKDRVEGSAKNIKGKVKEGFGKLTGDAKTEADGKADQAKGKAQNAVGGIKDTLRGR